MLLLNVILLFEIVFIIFFENYDGLIRLDIQFGKTNSQVVRRNRTEYKTSSIGTGGSTELEELYARIDAIRGNMRGKAKGLSPTDILNCSIKCYIHFVAQLMLTNL